MKANDTNGWMIWLATPLVVAVIVILAVAK